MPLDPLVTAWYWKLPTCAKNQWNPCQGLKIFLPCGIGSTTSTSSNGLCSSSISKEDDTHTTLACNIQQEYIKNIRKKKDMAWIAECSNYYDNLLFSKLNAEDYHHHCHHQCSVLYLNSGKKKTSINSYIRDDQNRYIIITSSVYLGGIIKELYLNDLIWK